MASSEIKISGLKELDELLKTLPAKIEGNIMRGAMRQGLRVMSDAAKNSLSSSGNVKTGELQKSVRLSFSRKNEGRYGWMRGKLIAGSKKAWYAHLIEFGTASFYTGKGKTVGGPYKIAPKKAGSLFFGGIAHMSSTHPGIKPQPFMRPAFDANGVKAIESFAEYVRTRLPKELKKVGR